MFQDEEPIKSLYGNAINRAKYWGDQSATRVISRTILEFTKRHPRFRSATAVTAPPKSDSRVRNLPREWARDLAESLDLGEVIARKTRPTEPQKKPGGFEAEFDVVQRVGGSMEVNHLAPGSSVIIVDDTLRSGGTIKELGRALRLAGAEGVYGLCVAKDAKFTNGGIELSKERWQ